MQRGQRPDVTQLAWDILFHGMGLRHIVPTETESRNTSALPGEFSLLFLLAFVVVFAKS